MSQENAGRGGILDKHLVPILSSGKEPGQGITMVHGDGSTLQSRSVQRSQHLSFEELFPDFDEDINVLLREANEPLVISTTDKSPLFDTSVNALLSATRGRAVDSLTSTFKTLLFDKLKEHTP